MDIVERWKVGLGIVVRRGRQEKALSQESFAHEVGLTRNAIQNLERGSTNPSFESLVKVAIALGTRPSDLLQEVAVLMANPVLFAKAIEQIEEERKRGRPSRVGLKLDPSASHQ
jgi:transcriptional regulator with XRE-family HTH domain